MADDKEPPDEGVMVSSKLLAILILGVALVIVGIVVLAVVSVLSSTSTSVGVVILIGPFPIVFGSGPNEILLIIIGLILAVLSVVVFLVMNRRVRG